MAEQVTIMVFGTIGKTVIVVHSPDSNMSTTTPSDTLTPVKTHSSFRDNLNLVPEISTLPIPGHGKVFSRLVE